MDTIIAKPTQSYIEEAGRLLRAGRLVAFPTETVYGLGANALMPEAAKMIYEVKGRPSDNPLIVHVSSVDDMYDLAEVNSAALPFIEKFMPGAATVVFKKKPIIPDTVTGGLDTVAIRLPSLKVARDIIRAAGVPVCAPSANTSSKPSPTKAEHVMADLKGKIPLIIDGGECQIGIESTIVDFSGDKPRLLRPGGIPREEIEKVIGTLATDVSSDRPLCPGMKYKHYSPAAEVFLFKDRELALRYAEENPSVVVIVRREGGAEKSADDFKRCALECFVMDDDYKYAHSVFDIFRTCDDKGVKNILCEVPLPKGIGQSLYNRLFKAAGGKFLEKIYG